jgi:hypothetical protein
LLEAEAAALKAKAEAEAAERAALEAPLVVAQSEPAAVTCEDCGRSFRSVNARNAHKCEGKRIVNELEAVKSENGKVHEAVNL